MAEAGGKAVPLAVSGGFHSPFMASAAEKLEKKLESVSLEPRGFRYSQTLTHSPMGRMRAS